MGKMIKTKVRLKAAAALDRTLWKWKSTKSCVAHTRTEPAQSIHTAILGRIYERFEYLVVRFQSRYEYASADEDSNSTDCAAEPKRRSKHVNLIRVQTAGLSVSGSRWALDRLQILLQGEFTNSLTMRLARENLALMKQCKR